MEKCENPFFSCTSTEPQKIAVAILYKGQRFNICQECWKKIAESDITWTSVPEDEDFKAKDLRRWA